MIFRITCILFFVTGSFCWEYYPSFNEMILTNSEPIKENLHSEYFYGQCTTKHKRWIATIRKNRLEILGKLIVREWLLIPRMPTCIIIRAYSHITDLFRSTAYPFQICVPRIIYAYQHTRYRYYYYEWYIPHDMIGGMNWELTFYAPLIDYWQ